MREPSLLVVTGPPGAGKSTVARLLAGDDDPDRPEPSVLVEGDAFFGFLAARSIPPWEPASQAQNEVVIDAIAAATERFVSAGWATVLDGIVGPWFLDRFLAGMGLGGADYVILLPTADRCQHRIRARAGHSFDDADAAAKMHREFDRATIDGRHRVDNGAEDAATTADRIRAARRAGHLRYRTRAD